MITEQQVRDAIAHVRENYDSQALPVEADFAEAGLDSLDHASMLLNLQETTGTVFSDDASDLNSIQAILDFAQQQTPHDT